MDRGRELHLALREVAVHVVRELLAEHENAIERSAQLVRHVGEELGLVSRCERELGRLLLDRAPRLLDLRVLAFDLRVLRCEEPGLLCQLLIGLLQLVLLALLLQRELLRLLEQELRAHRDLDVVQHDADDVGELLEQRDMLCGELAQARELDDGLHGAFEQHRKDNDGARLDVDQPRRNAQRARRQLLEHEAAALVRALSDQALVERIFTRIARARRIGIRRELLEPRSALGVGHDVHDTLVRRHERGELGQQHLRDRREVPLALQHAAELREVGLQPVLLGVAIGRLAEVADHRVEVILEVCHLAFRVDLDVPSEVALRHGGRDVRDGAHLRSEIRREQIHVGGEVLPSAGGAGHVRLTAESALDADLARDRRHLGGERRERVGHAVDRVRERGHLAFRLEGELLREVAVRDRGHDLDDAAHLAREVRGHDVHVVREVLPRARDARHERLAAELAFGADLACHARHLRRERVELIDDGVDRVLEVENLAFHVDRDLARQVAARDGRRDLGDVAHLRGEVLGHHVHVVGQILPRARDTGHERLAAELAFGADLARHARDFRRERVELVHHRVDGVLELQDLAFDVHRDLRRQVAARDGGRDVGDVADLRGEVAGHRVHVVGEVLPRARDARHDGLTAELALGADFARDARHLRRERVELVDHRVDGALELQDLAFDVDRDLARQVAARDGGRDLRDTAHLAREVRGHDVHVVREVLPRARDARHDGLAAELAFGADLARDARDFGCERPELVDHRVDGFFQLENFAAHVDRDLARQVAVRDRDRDLRDVAHLRREVAGHRVHAVGEGAPGARNVLHDGLAAEHALRADLARDARDFGREHVHLIDHPIHDPRGTQELAFERPALDLERHGLRQVALRDGRDAARDLDRRLQEVVDQPVDGGFHRAPSTRAALALHALACEAAFADGVAHALELRREPLLRRDDVVEGVRDLARDAAAVSREPHGEIAVADRHEREQQLARVDVGIASGLAEGPPDDARAHVFHAEAP